MTDLCDLAAERALLASVLLMPVSLPRLLTDASLRPEHFFDRGHAAAFRAMIEVTDRGAHLDHLTFTAELKLSDVYPDPGEFANGLYAISDPLNFRENSTEYARLIRDFHRRRQLSLAARLLEKSAVFDDADAQADAERMLSMPAELEQATWTAEQRKDVYFDRMNSPAEQKWTWPFGKLNAWTSGGVRRKQIVLIGGWTAMGKTVLFDQILEHLAGQGLRVHAYINEMSEAERSDRALARLSSLPFSAIYRGDLNEDQRTDAIVGIGRFNVGLTECEGWSADEIARHIRWNRWDVAGVDVVHEIPHIDERDLASIAQTLRAAAKQVGCILVACVHLNDQRVTSVQRPRPVLRDVRGTGMLVRGADVVLFVHRDDDEDGVPTAEGTLIAAKIRNGSPKAMGVAFEPQNMRFLAKAGDSQPSKEW